MANKSEEFVFNCGDRRPGINQQQKPLKATQRTGWIFHVPAMEYDAESVSVAEERVINQASRAGIFWPIKDYLFMPAVHQPIIIPTTACGLIKARHY